MITVSLIARLLQEGGSGGHDLTYSVLLRLVFVD